MGFFKDFKEDLTQAVNEMLPGSRKDNDAAEETLSDMPVEDMQDSTIGQDVDAAEEIVKLNGFLEDVDGKQSQSRAFLEIEEVAEDDAETQMSDADAFHEAVRAFESGTDEQTSDAYDQPYDEAVVPEESDGDEFPEDSLDPDIPETLDEDIQETFDEDMSEAFDDDMPENDSDDYISQDDIINAISDISEIDDISETEAESETEEISEEGEISQLNYMPEDSFEASAEDTYDPDYVDTIGETDDIEIENSFTEEIIDNKEEEEVSDFENDVLNDELDDTLDTAAGASLADEIESTSTISAEATDEEAIITKGMTIVGDLETSGSVEVNGSIKGNVKCNGKIVVTGSIAGNSEASEFFADSARIEGEIKTTGTVKIGHGSVIISATSAVIAGAIKGNIDVKGPVVVDTSAVVMGDIKSRSVQINNGAVIEGHCSQSYSDIDVNSLFN